jgi:phosphotransferase system enzyme I (PtsI)
MTEEHTIDQAPPPEPEVTPVIKESEFDDSVAGFADSSLMSWRSGERTWGERVLTGFGAAPGIVIGRVTVFESQGSYEFDQVTLSPDEVESEVKAFEEAVESSRQQLKKLKQKVAKRINESMAAIFDFHLLMLNDPMIVQATLDEIREEHQDAASLFSARIKKASANFEKLDDQYFRERSVDINDVGHRVLTNLGKIQRGNPQLSSDRTIVVAHDLTPSDTAHLDTDKVAAFITDKGGPTSHTAILARSLNIPAVVGLEKATKRSHDGMLVIVDAIAGRVIFNPTENTLSKYREYAQQYAEYGERLKSLADKPAETPDGFHIDLAANIELPRELEGLGVYGLSSIGLFRTEFLFLEEALPTEEEQESIYRQAVDVVSEDHGVTFRTLDIGGDKPTRALPFIEEDNPYLGLRGIRLCLSHRDLMRTQLRALLRASSTGKVKLMIPMVTTVEELRQVRELVRETMEELDFENIEYDAKIEIGIMVEVPSAAIMADKLAREADFFSIGTNDLIQYTLAVDRGNDHVAYLYNSFEPSVLRLIHTVIESAHRGGIVANLCGEMAGDPVAAIILLGMGIDELSMAASSVPHVKQCIRHFNLSDARDIAQEILTQSSARDVQEIIRQRILPIVSELEMPQLNVAL